MRVAHRGAYRAVASVLVDGPDWNGLTPEARLVFLTTKVAIGPSGIELIPAAMEAMRDRTGLPLGRVKDAVVELDAAGWMRVQGNVVWIVKGLAFEPSLIHANPKHRTAIRHHVQGLPRLEIVRQFVEMYREWFDDPDVILAEFQSGSESESEKPDSDANPKAENITSDSLPSPKRKKELRSKGERRFRVESESDSKSDSDSGSDPDFDTAWAAYPKKPNNPKAKALRAWRARITAGGDPAVMLAGVHAYAAYVTREDTPPQFIKAAATFFGPDRPYLDDYGPVESALIDVYDPVSGEPTPEFLKAMRG